MTQDYKKSEYKRGKYEQIATEVGQLVDQKNKAYGNSFMKAGDFLKILYPDGIPPEKYIDVLVLTRLFDKLMRIATKNDPFGEDPFQDIVGYALLGMSNRKQEKEDAIKKESTHLDERLNYIAEKLAASKAKPSTQLSFDFTDDDGDDYRGADCD